MPGLALRQRVISSPLALRLLFASRPEALARALEVIYRLLATHLAQKAGFRCKEVPTSAETLVQRFGSALTKSPKAISSSRRLTRRAQGRMPGAT